MHLQLTSRASQRDIWGKIFNTLDHVDKLHLIAPFERIWDAQIWWYHLYNLPARRDSTGKTENAYNSHDEVDASLPDASNTNCGGFFRWRSKQLTCTNSVGYRTGKGIAKNGCEHISNRTIRAIDRQARAIGNGIWFRIGWGVLQRRSKLEVAERENHQRWSCKFVPPDTISLSKP